MRTRSILHAPSLSNPFDHYFVYRLSGGVHCLNLNPIGAAGTRAGFGHCCLSLDVCDIDPWPDCVTPPPLRLAAAQATRPLDYISVRTFSHAAFCNLDLILRLHFCDVICSAGDDRPDLGSPGFVDYFTRTIVTGCCDWRAD